MLRVFAPLSFRDCCYTGVGKGKVAFEWLLFVMFVSALSYWGTVLGLGLCLWPPVVACIKSRKFRWFAIAVSVLLVLAAIGTATG